MSKHSDLHDEIVEILYELCEEHKTAKGKPRYSSIYADHIGLKYKPKLLSVDIGKRIKPLAKKYSPDVWARVKGKNLLDIYEVWHSETEGDAVEDILFSAFVDGVRYLHIVCTGENLVEDDADELAYLILSRIRDEEGKKLLDRRDVYIAEVPDKLWNDKSKMKRYLRNELLL